MGGSGKCLPADCVCCKASLVKVRHAVAVPPWCDTASTGHCVDGRVFGMLIAGVSVADVYVVHTASRSWIT